MDGAALRYLDDAGFIPGATGTVTTKAPDGTLIVSVGEQSVALGWISASGCSSSLFESGGGRRRVLRSCSLVVLVGAVLVGAHEPGLETDVANVRLAFPDKLGAARLAEIHKEPITCAWSRSTAVASSGNDGE